MAEFAEWVLQIGDGKTASNEGDDWIKIPKDLILHKAEYPKRDRQKHIPKLATKLV